MSSLVNCVKKNNLAHITYDWLRGEILETTASQWTYLFTLFKQWKTMWPSRGTKKQGNRHAKNVERSKVVQYHHLQSNTDKWGAPTLASGWRPNNKNRAHLTHPPPSPDTYRASFYIPMVDSISSVQWLFIMWTIPLSNAFEAFVFFSNPFLICILTISTKHLS